MKLTDIAADMMVLRDSHKTIVELMERTATYLDETQEILLRDITDQVVPTGPNGQRETRALLWQQCEQRLGAHLNAARSALVRELLDYAQAIALYERAQRRPLTPRH